METNIENRLVALETEYSPRLTSAESNLTKILNQLDPTKKYKIVSGAIRNTGGGFFFINDSVHNPVGVSSVTNDTNSITVNYDFEANKVISFVVVPDETMASKGISVGASVGTTFSRIDVYRNYNVIGYITKSGGSSPSYSINTSLSSNITSASANGASLDIYHEHIDFSQSSIGKVSTRDMNTEAYISSHGLNLTRVSFRRKSKIQSGYLTYNGTSFELGAGSGISGVWNDAEDRLEVTFTNSFVEMIPTVIAKSTTYNPVITSYGTNSIYIQFYNSAGNLVTSADTNMKTIVTANELSNNADIYAPDGTVILIEKNANVKMNPNNLTYEGSNFWFYGIFEIE